MKKLFFCLTIFMILFFLISCGGSKTTDDTDSGEIQNDEDSVDTDPTDTDIPDNTDDEPAEEADQDETDTEFSEEGGLCPNPCEEIANSTGVCILKDVQYICECYADYEWNGFSCVRSVPLTLGNICTGQTACYDMSSSMKCPSSPEADFYGQDWQYAELGYCTLQSFTDLPDVIVDNNTGLIWEKSPSSGTYIWEETQNHCDDLNKEVFAGIDSWRVPNPLELLTIVDNSTSQQATNSNFKRMAELWTSKSYEGESGTSAYYFSSFFGSVSSKNKTERLKVLCVSGDEMQAAQESDFEISEDEMTVTDKRTGLVWEKITILTWIGKQCWLIAKV